MKPLRPYVAVYLSRSTRPALKSGGRTLETLKGELRQLLTEVASLPEGFDEKADLYSDLGMASIKAMALLAALEERYEVSVPDEEFIEATSLDRLAVMMRKLKG
jgi:acyl carrier protein